MWGAAPRPGRGGAANATPENGERRTENARQARDEEIVGVWGGAPPRKPSLQASKLPSFHLPLHPRHVRWTCQLNDAVESSGYALTYSGLPVARLSRVLFSVLCSRGRFGPSGLHAPFSWAQSAPFLHPRHVCDVPSRRPQKMQEIQERPCGATDGVPEKAIRRETEGGGRGQRRSRRATDGARSGSRPPLRLCGFNFPRTLLMHAGERILV